MKRKVALMLAFALALSSLTACGKSSSSQEETSDGASSETESSVGEDGVIYDESLLPEVSVSDGAMDDIVDKLSDIDGLVSQLEWAQTYRAVMYSSIEEDNCEYVNEDIGYYTYGTYTYTYVPSDGAALGYDDEDMSDLLYGSEYLTISYNMLSGDLMSMTVTSAYTGLTEEYIADTETLIDDFMALLVGDENAEQLRSMYYNQSAEIVYKDGTATVTKTGELNEYDQTTTYEIETSNNVVVSDIERSEAEANVDLGIGYASSIDELEAFIAEDFMVDDEIDLQLISASYSYADGSTTVEYQFKDSINGDVAVIIDSSTLTLAAPLKDGYDSASLAAIALSAVATRITGEMQVIVTDSAEIDGLNYIAYSYDDNHIAVTVY